MAQCLRFKIHEPVGSFDGIALSSSEKKTSSLLKSSLVVSAMTMLSRVLGLVRDILFARMLGAGGDADVFYIAFKVPNFFRRLFAEGAFAQAFVPVLSEFRERGSYAAVRHFIDRVAGCLGVSLIGLVVFVVLASPLVAGIFGFGYWLDEDKTKFWLTSDLLKITFPYLFLISMTGFAGAILNSYDRFAVPSVTPVILNLTLIVAAAFVSPHLDRPVMALAWGVLVAGVLQLGFQLPFLARLALLPKPKVDWKDESVRKVLRLMAPAMFGVSVGQINLLLDTVLATFLVDKSVTWLYFSDRLMELPLGIFGIGIATVVLPSLSRQHSSGGKGYSQTIDWALRMILLIGVPAAIALAVLAQPILFTLLQYDKMEKFDIVMSSYSLQAYSLGLVAFMLIKILASSYFSRQDTKTPVKVGVIAMASNMVLNLLFVVPLMMLWDIGHVGLALATSCSAFLNAGLLYRGLRKADVFLPQAGWVLFFVRLCLANALMIVTLVVLSFVFGDFSEKGVVERIVDLSLLIFAGAITYLVGMLAMGMRPKDLHPLKS